MKLWRAIKYGLSILFKRRKKPLHSYVDNWDNPPLIKRLWDKTSGFFYNLYESRKERFKIWRWAKSEDAKEENIIFEVVQKSSKRLISFVVIFLSLWIIDYVLNAILRADLINTLPMKYADFVQNFLGIMIGALSAFIALIFSLYGVVVQVIMQKYSTPVTKYINEDKFPNFFLRGLVFIDLFAIFLYLRGELLPSTPIVISFAFLVFAIGYSMIALLLFKDSYTYSIKPDNLFTRLGGDIVAQINIAAGYDKAVRDSISVIHHSGEKARELFDVLESLFDDLLREKNLKDISKAPPTLAFVFLDYVEKRKFIEDEQGWWFPKHLQLVKGDSMSSFIIKANYEMQGRGVLHMPVRNKEWFEQRTKELLDLMTRSIPIINEDAYTRAVILAYNFILAGKYTQNEYGQYNGKIRGAYENGEMEMFKLFYEEFAKLPNILDFSSESVSIEYLNTLFAVGLVLLDENKKVLQVIEKFLKKIVADDKVVATIDDLKKLNLPKHVHNLFCELFEGLNAEIVCEGKVITPTEVFTKEILYKLKEKYEKDADELFTHVLEDIDVLLAKLFEEKQYETCLRLIELEIRWFQKLVYLDKFDFAIKHSKALNTAYKYVVKTPVNDLQKIGLLDALELLIFPVAIANKKDLFSPLSAMLIFLLQFVYTPQQEKPEEQLLLLRTLVVIGGLLYLIGEFEENFSLLKIYAEKLHIIYPDTAKTLGVLEKLKRDSGMILSGKIINREATRYHHWFGVMHGKIDSLPKVLYQTKIYAGMSEAANHPSNFIKEMSVGSLFDEDECIEKFIEWLEKKYPPIEEASVTGNVEPHADNSPANDQIQSGEPQVDEEKKDGPKDANPEDK